MQSVGHHPRPQAINIPSSIPSSTSTTPSSFNPNPPPHSSNTSSHAQGQTMPGTDAARYSLPALQSLDLPQPAGPLARPPTSGQSLAAAHQLASGGPPPPYRNGPDFNRLPSLAGTAASLPHMQSSANGQDRARESNYPPASGYDSSRILPRPVPQSNSYPQLPSSNTLPPLSASTAGPRDASKNDEPARPNGFHPPPAPLRSQQQYPPATNTLNGDSYQQEMTPSYSTSTLVHGRTPSQASTFGPSQRPMPAPSPESSAFYSPANQLVNKTEAWAGEDQYSYLSGTVNGVDQDPSEMDPAAIMQVVVNHCNAIVQFSAQYGATPRGGAVQTPSPSPNAAFSQGIPDDKLSDMVNRAIAVVRLLRTLTHRQANQEKSGQKGLLDGLELEGTPTVDGDTDLRPGKRMKPSPTKEAVDADAPKPKYKKRSRAPPPAQCASCGIAETPEWRKGPDGARTLCNACGLHFAKLSRNRERDVDATGRPIRPPVNIDMLRNSIRATCQPARAQATTQAEQAASSSAKPGRIQERHAPNSTYPMVWEAPVAARPANPYAASAVEQANMAQMQASSYPSSSAHQSPADSLQSSGYGGPAAAQSPASAIPTSSYPTPTSHLSTSAYPTPLPPQASDPLYQLAQAAGSAWNSQGSTSQAQSNSSNGSHSYWAQQPQGSLLANQMSNVRTDLPEPPMNGWSGMRMQPGGPMGYGQPPAGNSAQMQENARVYA